jgi:ribosomal protein L12E/L44/L45/RPP1/RPP2
MTTLKRDARYVDLCLARTEMTDRCIKGGLAIAASTSIAGWAIFKEYTFVWASIVASQVVQAVKEYLPYKTRLKALAGLSQDLNAIGLAAENHWYKVSAGALYDDDIHELRFDLKQRKLAAVQKAFPASGLPENKKLATQAETETQQYFEIYL